MFLRIIVLGWFWGRAGHRRHSVTFRSWKWRGLDPTQKVLLGTGCHRNAGQAISFASTLQISFSYCNHAVALCAALQRRGPAFLHITCIIAVGAADTVRNRPAAHPCFSRCWVYPSFLPDWLSCWLWTSVPDTEASDLLRLFNQFSQLWKVKFL